MTNDEGMTKSEARKLGWADPHERRLERDATARVRIRHSLFVIRSSLGIPSFVISRCAHGARI
jgi:hypothetical protein